MQNYSANILINITNKIDMV